VAYNLRDVRYGINNKPAAFPTRWRRRDALIQAELRPGVAYNLRDVRYGINNKPAAFPTRWRRRDALIQAELRPGVAYNVRDVRYGINNKPAAFPTRWRRRDALIQAELRPARHAIYVKAVRISTTRAIRSPCGQAVRCLWLHSGSPQLPRGLVSRTAFQNPHAPAPVASD
jgi:hypothetical protein